MGCCSLWKVKFLYDWLITNLMFSFLSPLTPLSISSLLPRYFIFTTKPTSSSASCSCTQFSLPASLDLEPEFCVRLGDESLFEGLTHEVPSGFLQRP